MVKSDDGFYKCIGDNSLGNVEYEYKLVVNTVPVILINDHDDQQQGVTSLTITSGEDMILNCPSSGYPRPTTSWTLPYSVTQPVTEFEGRLTVNNINRTHRGSYICHVSNEAGAASHSFDIIVQHKPVISENTFENGLVEVLAGENLQLPCYVVSNPEPTIKWFQYKEGKEGEDLMAIKTSLDSALTITEITETKEGLWTCVAENEIGATNITYHVDVQTAPILEFQAGTSLDEFQYQTFMAGENAKISCPITADPFPAYTWEDFNGNIVSTDRQLQFYNLQLSDIGEYNCEGLNIHGSINTNIFVDVQEKPMMTFNSDSIITVDHCTSYKNCQTELACSARGNPRPRFTWFRNNQVYLQSEDLRLGSRSASSLIDEYDPEFTINSKIVVNEPGIYTCQAANDIGIENYDMKVNFMIAPNFDELENENNNQNLQYDKDGNLIWKVEAILGEPLELECPVSGFPVPTVDWSTPRSNGFTVEFRNSSSYLKIKNVNLLDKVGFSCTSTNIVGQIKQIFDINVFYEPILELQQIWPNWIEEDQVNLSNQEDIQFLNEILNSNKQFSSVEVTEGFQQSAFISCNIIESNPLPEIIWYKDNIEITDIDKNYVKRFDVDDKNKHHKFVSKSTLEIKKFSVDDDNSIYTCKALNKAGKTKKNINFIVNVPVSLKNSQNYTTDYFSVEHGNHITLFCNAFGKPTPKINWYSVDDPDKILGTGREFEILPEASLEVVCQAENKINKISKKYAIDVLTYPQIMNQDMVSMMSESITGSSSRSDQGSFEENLHTQGDLPVDDDKSHLINEFNFIELSCYTKGNPLPEVIWYKDNIEIDFKDPINKDSMFLETFIDDTNLTSVLTFKNITRENQGVYSCEARNYLGNDKYDQFVFVQTRPEVVAIDLMLPGFVGEDKTFDTNTNSRTNTNSLQINEKTGKPQVKKGESIIAVCTSKGTPEPYVYWIINDNFKNKIPGHQYHFIAGADDTFIGQNSKPFEIPSIDSNSINIKCIAENELGESSIQQNLDIIFEPQLIQDEIFEKVFDMIDEGEDTIERYRYNLNPLERDVGDFSAKIRANSNPAPEITCIDEFDNEILSSLSSSLSKQNEIELTITEEQAATLKQITFTCTADNRLGYDTKVYTIEILRGPEFVKPDIKNGLNGTDIIHEKIVTLAPTLSPMVSSAIEIRHLDKNVNGSAILDCSIFDYANPTPSITWYKNGREIRNKKIVSKKSNDVNDQIVNHLINFKKVSVTDIGNYKCIIENHIAKIERKFKVNVNIPPTIQIPYKTKFGIFENELIELHCRATGRPLPSIQWHFNGKKLKVADNQPIYKIPSASINNMGDYKCLASNSVGDSELSFSVQVYVPPSLSSKTGGIINKKTAEIGKDIFLKCPISENVYPKPEITWLFNGNLLEPHEMRLDKNKTLEISGMSLENAGIYTCMVENIAGKIAIQYKVTLVEKPSVVIKPKGDIGIDKLEKETLYLTCLVSGHPLPDIEWYFIPDNSFDTIENFSFQEDFSYFGNYSSLVTARSVLKNVNTPFLNPPGQTQSQTRQNLAQGQTIKLTASPTIKFSLDNSKATISDLTVKNTGEYECRAKNTVGIASDFKTVQVYAKPKFQTPQIPKLEIIEVLYNASLDLSCKLSAGYPTPEIYWYYAGEIVDFLHDFIEMPIDNSEISIDYVTSEMDGKTLSCEANNLAGTITKHYKLKLIMPPKKSQPSEGYTEINTVMGHDIQLDCKIKASPPFTVEWFKDNNILDYSGYDIRKVEYKSVQSNNSASGQDSQAPSVTSIVQSLKIYDIKEHNQGEYLCKVKNKAGENEHLTIVEVYQSPQIIGKSHEWFTGVDTESIELNCEIYADPKPSITWYYNGKRINLAVGKYQKDFQIRSVSGNTHKGESILTINKLDILKHAGPRFACIGENLVGRITKKISLKVLVHPKIQPTDSKTKYNVIKGMSPGRDFFDFFTGAGLFGLLLG